MKQLTNGNRRSEITVSPANWRSSKASTKKKWQIQYRFYQPGRPPKLVVVKLMNAYSDLKDRQEATEALIRQITYDLDERGYNPNTFEFQEYVGEISRHTPFIEALKAVFPRIEAKKKTLIDIKSVIKGCENSACKLVYDVIPVGEIRTKHITLLLEDVGRTNPRWSPRRHNLYRAYLMRLFRELIKLEAIDLNPAQGVEIKTQEKKLRETLSPELRQKIDTHLREVNYPFWRFVHIFFHSGARETELLKVQIKHIDLPNQRYMVRIEKGKQNKWVWKTIKTVALPLWIEAMGEAEPEMYLFSKGLKPGLIPIGTDKLNRRWRKYVKEKFNTNIDLYSLKHLNTSEIVERLGDQAAAQMNSHTSTGMVINVYDTNRATRLHEFLKGVDNSFSAN